ncbi:hypothetical protein OROHE_021773 [Orobanche hederae]
MVGPGVTTQELGPSGFPPGRWALNGLLPGVCRQWTFDLKRNGLLPYLTSIPHESVDTWDQLFTLDHGLGLSSSESAA